MRGVFNIRKYYQETQTMDKLNVRTLVLHACAFGLYLVATSVVLVSLIIYVAFPFGETSKDWFAICLSVWFFLSTVSQLLLCAIFWQLATKQDLNETISTVGGGFAPIVVQEFDEEAQIQARIWF